MRTVHEPEPGKGLGEGAPITSGKGKNKIKLAALTGNSKPPIAEEYTGPVYDEDGNEIDPSPPNDNITYIPAHHPITGQPGFMIHYPPDIHFTAWESSIPADQLMKLLRRQLHWAEKDGAVVAKELEELEKQKMEEWMLKEILFEGVMEAEMADAAKDDLLRDVEQKVQEAMLEDTLPAKQLSWTHGEPAWRRRDAPAMDWEREAEAENRSASHNSPSPPPTGASGGFDGEEDPYDNFVKGQMAAYEERMRSMQNTPASKQNAAEADTIAALVGMAGGE